MAHWKSMTEREYLYAFDLGGRERDVQIKRVTGANIVGVGGKKSKKPTIYFEGMEKPLIGNATNCKAIAAIVGDHDVDKWIGQWITLFPTTCAAASGEIVECIRVKPKAPNRQNSGGGGGRSRDPRDQRDPQSGLPIDPGGP